MGIIVMSLLSLLNKSCLTDDELSHPYLLSVKMQLQKRREIIVPSV